MYTLFGHLKESKQFDYFLSVFLYKSIWKVGGLTIGVCSLQIQLYWIS